MIDLQQITNAKEAKEFIEYPEFYFQKGQDALKQWLDLSVSEELRNRLLTLSKDYKKIQAESNNDEDIKQILNLLLTITSYCDSNAKDKHIYNGYEDKRTLALAFVRMNNWLEHLVLFKFSPEKLPNGSPKNAFSYLLDPRNNATILSENHRELVSKNLFKKQFQSSEFVNDLKAFFSDYNLSTKNPDNYTHLLSWLIYSIQSEWKEDVIGLMASDGTGWQDDFIDEMEGFDLGVVWNSKRPSGTTETLKFLRSIVDSGNSFNLYYSSGGNVHYRASVIDFAENQQELDRKQWDKKQGNILHYNSKFNDYKDFAFAGSSPPNKKAIKKVNEEHHLRQKLKMILERKKQEI